MTLKIVIELEKAEIVRFTNRKFAKQALYNRKKLKSIGKSTLGFNNDVFINENLTPVNNKIAYNCRKLKRQNLILKTYTINGTVHIVSNNIKRGNQLKFFTCKCSSIYFQMQNLKGGMMRKKMWMSWLMNPTSQAIESMKYVVLV